MVIFRSNFIQSPKYPFYIHFKFSFVNMRCIWSKMGCFCSVLFFNTVGGFWLKTNDYKNEKGKRRQEIDCKMMGYLENSDRGNVCKPQNVVNRKIWQREEHKRMKSQTKSNNRKRDRSLIDVKNNITKNGTLDMGWYEKRDRQTNKQIW